jgi:hypothetical protein
MSEFPSEPTPEKKPKSGFWQLVEQYMPEDREYLEDMDERDRLGYVYAQLIGMHLDPDAILAEFKHNGGWR